MNNEDDEFYKRYDEFTAVALDMLHHMQGKYKLDNQSVAKFLFTFANLLCLESVMDKDEINDLLEDSYRDASELFICTDRSKLKLHRD